MEQPIKIHPYLNPKQHSHNQEIHQLLLHLPPLTFSIYQPFTSTLMANKNKQDSNLPQIKELHPFGNMLKESHRKVR